MKVLLLTILILYSFLAKAQESDGDFNKLNSDTFKFSGYINDVALKSIKANFAVVETQSLTGSFSQVYDLSFDYGQQWNKEKELKLTDKKGKMLIFRSLGHLLNFLDENGWVLMDILSGSQFGKSVQLIMKRKVLSKYVNN